MAAWTQADLDELERSIAQGVLTVKFRDKETTYRSLEQMVKTRDLLRKDLGLSPKSRTMTSSHSRGLST